MAKKIRTIPATINRFTAVPINEHRKRRTAGYARVSTDEEDQATSYAAQIDYYTKYINNHMEWEFVKIYTDERETILIRNMEDNKQYNGICCNE